MGMLDNLRGKAEELKDKAGELAAKHGDQIDQVVDKAGGALDKATKGKYSEKIEHGAGRAKDAVGDFAHKPADPNAPGDAPGPTA